MFHPLHRKMERFGEMPTINIFHFMTHINFIYKRKKTCKPIKLSRVCTFNIKFIKSCILNLSIVSWTIMLYDNEYITDSHV